MKKGSTRQNKGKIPSLKLFGRRRFALTKYPFQADSVRTMHISPTTQGWGSSFHSMEADSPSQCCTLKQLHAAPFQSPKAAARENLLRVAPSHFHPGWKGAAWGDLQSLGLATPFKLCFPSLGTQHKGFWQVGGIIHLSTVQHHDDIVWMTGGLPHPCFKVGPWGGVTVKKAPHPCC